MANFTMSCPFCGQHVEAEEEWIGMNAECPNCGKSFTVTQDAPPPPPAPEEDAAAPEPPSADTYSDVLSGRTPLVPMKSFLFVCPSCSTQVELPGVMRGKPYICAACAEEAIAEPATEKPCPFCGQPIKPQATFCKYCKNPLAPAADPAGAFAGAANPGATGYGRQTAPQSRMPYGQQPQYGTPVLPPWTLTDPQVRSINGITKLYFAGFYCLIAGLAVILLGVLLIIIGATAESEATGIAGSIVIFLLSQPPLQAGSIMSLVALMILTYKYWRLVPPQEAETTPGKAIGFLFIPFFNLYWMFVAFWQLSRHYDRFAPFDRRVATLALLSVIFNLAGFVTCGLTSPVGLIMQALWISRMRQIARSLPKVG